MLHPADARDLEQYFGPAQSVFGASNFGSMLARQEVLHRTSDGKVVDTTRSGIVWRELDGSTPEKPQFAKLHTAFLYMDVSRTPIETHATEAELDAREDQRHSHWLVIARVSRRLERLDPATRLVLWLLYGDEGARWHQQPQGRAWPLAVRTEPARKALAADIERRAAQGLAPRCHPIDKSDKKAQPVPLLATEVAALLARDKPTPPWATAAIKLAERQQKDAENAYLATKDFDGVARTRTGGDAA